MPPALKKSWCLAAALVGDADVHALVEVAQLPQALAQHLEGEVQLQVEDLGVGLEAHPGAAAGGGAHQRQGGVGLAPGEGHGVLLAVPPDGEPEALGEGVHAGDADAVQPAGDLVGVVVELAAGVEHRHDHFGGGAVLLLVQVRGNAAAVVLHRAAAVVVDDTRRPGCSSPPGLRPRRCPPPRRPSGGGRCRHRCRRCTSRAACARPRGRAAR